MADIKTMTQEIIDLNVDLKESMLEGNNPEVVKVVEKIVEKIIEVEKKVDKKVLHKHKPLTSPWGGNDKGNLGNIKAYPVSY